MEAEVHVLEGPARHRGIGHVGLEVLALRGDVPGPTLREVVDHANLPAVLEEPPDHCAADEARASGDEDHSSSPTPNVARRTPAAVKRSRSRSPQQSSAIRGSAISAATSAGSSD
jgi:hypothetical protein